MSGLFGVRSTNPYLAKLLKIFDGAAPAGHSAQTGDMASFLQELETQNNPSNQVSPAKTHPAGTRPAREKETRLSPRPNIDTVEISEEAYAAFKQMQSQKDGRIDS